MQDRNCRYRKRFAITVLALTLAMAATAATAATSAPAEIATPAPGSTLTSSTITFQWTGGIGATDYWLYVGTTQGGLDIYSADRGTSLSATVSNLPTNG